MTINNFQFFFLCLICILANVCYVDIKYKKIKNGQNLSLIAVGMLFGLIVKSDVAGAVTGAIAGGGILVGVRQVHFALRGQEGIGFGDIKFMIGAGTWVGWEGVTPLLLIASSSALLLFGVGSLVMSEPLKVGQKLAFGPFLAGALLAVFLLQEWQMAPWALS